MEPNIEKHWFELFSYNLPTNFDRYIIRIKRSSNSHYESSFIHNSIRYLIIFDAINRKFTIKPEKETVENPHISGVFRNDENAYQLYFDGIENPYNAVIKRFNIKNHLMNLYNLTIRNNETGNKYIPNVRFTVDNLNAITEINNTQIRLNYTTMMGLYGNEIISWIITQNKNIQFTYLNDTYEFVPIMKTLNNIRESFNVQNYDLEQTMFILCLVYLMYHIIK
jgi:hypothetical protein